MTNEAEIFARLTALHSALVAKLGAQPFLGPSLELRSGGTCSIAIYSPYSRGQYKDLHRAKAETIAACLADAEAFVAAMPGAEMLARTEWRRKLADVIDEGHALALPDEVMAPLRQGSQAMTENLLTHSAT
jgi:hypothetical protein